MISIIKIKPVKTAEKGFTITELMVALTVLSTLLLLSTMILIQLGVIYSKGVNTSNLQNATRNTASEILSTIQFSGTVPELCNGAPQNTCYTGTTRIASTPSGNVTIYAYCVNTVRYSYVMNRALGRDTDPTVDESDQITTPHVMWRDTLRSAYLPCKPLDISKDTVLSDDASLEGDGIPSKGHEMMPNHTRLTRFFVTDPPSPTSSVYNLEIVMAYGDSDLISIVDSKGNAICKGGRGTEYCAVSQLSSSVTRRVE